jgi:glycine cleavage system transcriptional repressor
VPELAVAVLGPDRPGVIAALSEVVLAEHGNLLDASMTILRGQFAMTLIVDVPVDADRVRADLGPVADRLGLLVSVRAVGAIEQGPATSPYIVHVHGADRPGIVHRITGTLASYGANVTDLTTRLAEGLYVLVAEIAVPASVDIAALQADVAAAAADLGITATVQPADSDVL